MCWDILPDSLQEEQEANLMACLLIAPKNKLPTYLKNAKDLPYLQKFNSLRRRILELFT